MQTLLKAEFRGKIYFKLLNLNFLNANKLMTWTGLACIAITIIINYWKADDLFYKNYYYFKCVLYLMSLYYLARQCYAFFLLGLSNSSRTRVVLLNFTWCERYGLVTNDDLGLSTCCRPLIMCLAYFLISKKNIGRHLHKIHLSYVDVVLQIMLKKN